MTTTDIDVTLIVTPGDLLGNDSEFESGAGTFIANNHSIYSSLTGIKNIHYKLDRKEKPVISIHSSHASITVPQPGDLVTARITKINSRFASCAIHCVGSILLPSPFNGVIRSRDVRLFEIDSVEIGECFRPGDLIKAKIQSLGDHRSYFLTTAANELGVIEAISEAAAVMTPISWTEMECPITKVKEQRKVARID